MALSFYLHRPKDAPEGSPFVLTVERQEVVVDDEPTNITEDNYGDEMPKLRLALRERFGEDVEPQ